MHMLTSRHETMVERERAGANPPMAPALNRCLERRVTKLTFSQRSCDLWLTLGMNHGK